MRGTVFIAMINDIDHSAKNDNGDETGASDIAMFDWYSMFIYDFRPIKEHGANPILSRGISFKED